MTNEEAIERLKKRICNEGANREDKTYHFCTDGCLYGEEECEIALAIKALEKQIPKKVIWKFGGDGLPYAYCSACGNSVIRGNYCDKCGQALDWSEENANNS